MHFINVKVVRQIRLHTLCMTLFSRRWYVLRVLEFYKWFATYFSYENILFIHSENNWKKLTATKCTSSNENCLSPTSSIRKQLLLNLNYFPFDSNSLASTNLPFEYLLSNFEALELLKMLSPRSCRNLHVENNDLNS